MSVSKSSSSQERTLFPAWSETRLCSASFARISRWTTGIVHNETSSAPVHVISKPITFHGFYFSLSFASPASNRVGARGRVPISRRSILLRANHALVRKAQGNLFGKLWPTHSRASCLIASISRPVEIRLARTIQVHIHDAAP